MNRPAGRRAALAFLFAAACGSGKTSPPQPPSAPTGLTAAGGVGQVALSWNPVPGVRIYVILRGDTSGGSKGAIARWASTSYTDSGLGPGVTKFYAVQAVGSGGTSADSAEVSATTVPLPASPTGVAAVAGNQQIALTWNAVPAATGYQVLRSDTSGGASVVIASPTANSYTDAGLADDTTEFYTVRAVGLAGTGAASREVSATTPPPGPTGLSAIAANASVALTWTAVVGANSYEVLRGPAGGTAAQIGTSAAASYVDTTPRNGVTYQYRVRALAAAGESAASMPVNARPYRELCVSDKYINRVVVFDAESSGYVSPLRSFGSLTGLYPDVIAVDAAHGEIFSLNYVLGTVTTHAQSADGNTAPLRTLSGLNAFSVAYDPVDDKLFVGDLNGIEVFDRSASGNVPADVRAVRTLQLSNSTTQPNRIAFSGPTHGDRMFVANVRNNTIDVFSRTDSGTTPPTAVISFSGVFSLADIAYDPVSDEVLAAVFRSNASDAVFAFPAASNGPTTPSRVLVNPDPYWTAYGLAVDAANDLLYIVSHSAVTVFPLGFGTAANLSPLRTVSGPTTQLDHTASATALDPVHGRLAVTSEERILTFDAAATGDAKPVSAISSISSGIESPGGISVDLARGEIFVANEGEAQSISTHGVAAQGGVAPMRLISNPNFGYGDSDLFFDAAHGELILSPGNWPAVQFFARDATGSAAPLRVLQGSHTLLQRAISVGLDTANDAVVVGDTAGAIRRYPRSFTAADQAPLTSISGPSTGLDNNIQGLFVDNVNGEIFVADKFSVLAFALAADGDAAPLRSLQAPSAAYGVYVDAVADEVFVMEFGGRIDVYARTASGNAPPLRTIQTSVGSLVFPVRGAVCNAPIAGP